MVGFNNQTSCMAGVEQKRYTIHRPRNTYNNNMVQQQQQPQNNHLSQLQIHLLRDACMVSKKQPRLLQSQTIRIYFSSFQSLLSFSPRTKIDGETIFSLRQTDNKSSVIQNRKELGLFYSSCYTYCRVDINVYRNIIYFRVQLLLSFVCGH